MKNRYFILATLAFFSYSLNAYAINSPLIDSIPSSVDADTYTLTIYVEEGATVNVVGGPSQLAPVTDGSAGDTLDGEVEVEVALGQNTVNSFSVTAQKGTDISDAVLVEINEVTVSGGSGVHIPATPVLKEIPDFVDTIEYIITGTTEPNMNIYAYSTEGVVEGSGQSNEDGLFQITVPLEENKTNRFNITAEDPEGGESSAVQAVIRQSVDLVGEPEEEPAPKLVTSSQIFFNDIQGHWAETYINELYQQEVVSGKSEGVFDPNGLITRAELTKIAILAFGHSVNPTPSEHPFQDVPRNSWFAPYVEEAKRLGIISGYESGGFGPNDFITRAAALKILLGAAGIKPIGMVPDFEDVSTDDWYANYVGFAQEEGIVGGYEDGTFGPANNMTRAQVAKVVIKLLEYLESQES